MKRFYSSADATPDGRVMLDGRPVRTPARAVLALPTSALADAVAAEWAAQDQTIEPRKMRLTGLANAAIDRVAPDPHGFAAGLARYAECDLLCYRAEEPPELAARQAQTWDPLLEWARCRYDCGFAITAGVIHVPQPSGTVARLGEAIASRSPFELAALSTIVTVSGSLVIALALLEGKVAVDAAFDAAHLDELWQAELWGEDDLATEARQARRTDFRAAARFLTLLGLPISA